MVLRNTLIFSLFLWLTGPVLKEMVNHFKLKRKHSLSPDRKLFVYSGHDTTIANFLMTLGVFEAQIPPYTALVMVELYKNDANDYSVRVSKVHIFLLIFPYLISW